VILPYELLLVLCAIGLYIFDSSMLMYANEMVLVRKASEWQIVLPGGRWELMRKHPYVPNPFTPHHGLIRATWYPRAENGEGYEGYDKAGLLEMEAALRPVQALTLSLLALLLVGLPCALLVVRTQSAFLIALAFIYFNIIFMLAIVFSRRRDFRLANTAFAKLAFDSLACAPLAINMVRRLYLRHGLRSNALSFLGDICGRKAVSAVAAQLIMKVDEMLESCDENSADESRVKKISLEKFKHDLQKFKQ
jgi:hypothetical protein